MNWRKLLHALMNFIQYLFLHILFLYFPFSFSYLIRNFIYRWNKTFNKILVIFNAIIDPIQMEFISQKFRVLRYMDQVSILYSITNVEKKNSGIFVQAEHFENVHECSTKDIKRDLADCIDICRRSRLLINLQSLVHVYCWSLLSMLLIFYYCIWVFHFTDISFKILEKIRILNFYSSPVLPVIFSIVA